MEFKLLRYYTVTIKPTCKAYKGNQLILAGAYQDLLSIVNGQTEEITYEKVGTSGLHLHALIKCEKISSSSHYQIMKLLHGFHFYKKIVSKTANHQTVIDTWKRYIHKERSDSDRFYNVFGNQFPLEELYEAGEIATK